jgi:hypothetical protein
MEVKRAAEFTIGAKCGDLQSYLNIKWRWKDLWKVPQERSDESYGAILHGMEMETTCYALERGTERPTDRKREDLHH